jgi:diguanylate cyclase (GGDEF)-like protein/PAS domain S-box-containing protein
MKIPPIPDNKQERLITTSAAAEREFLSLAENSPDSIYRYDREGRRLSVNAMVSKLSRKSASELIGKSLNDDSILDADQRQKLMDAIHRVFDSGENGQIDLGFITRAGDYRDYHMLLVPELDALGNVESVLAIARDITEIKNAQRQMEQFVANLPGFAYSFHLSREGHGSFPFASPGIEKIYGLKPEDVKDDMAPLHALAHPEDAPRIIEALAESARTMMPAHVEYRICRPGLAESWVEFLSTPVRQADGSMVWHGILLDITGRKRVEEDLRESERLFRTLTDHALVGIDIIQDNQFSYVNPAFAEVFGYSQNELIGANPTVLVHPDDRELVAEQMRRRTSGELPTMDYKFRGRRKNGETRYIEVFSVQVSLNGHPAIMANLLDITERKQAEERIDRLAHFDQLTGLPNRNLLNDHFKYAISLAQRSGESLAVMFIDLDHFKDINDTLGHSIGDQILMEVARRLKAVLREEDSLSRQGGDEYVVILPRSDADNAALVASKLIEAVTQPCHIEQHELIVTPSIGIAIYPNDGNNIETLSKNADTAMYRAKQEGRNDFRFYSPEMQIQSARNLQLANALRHALAQNELKLHYQPQVSIQDGHIVGAEALLRWQHPELGMISPAEFIPIAEDTGQIIQIGEWVLHTASKQLKDWLDRGLPPITIAVNLSAVQFRQNHFPETITRILDEVRLPHQYLELELTEAVAMDNPRAAIEVMNKLHERGIRMSIDDFGTGYSSLSYLKKFKVYKLKIDQSFVRDITDDPEDKAIVTAIIHMAASLGMQTIAEGVETASQLSFLRLQGCNEVQGYYFSKPLTAEQFEEFARKRIFPLSAL